MKRKSVQVSGGLAASALVLAILITVLPSPARGGVAVPPSVRPAPPPVIHLTWHEPYGSPRATTSNTSSCDDTTTLDTLWLTYECPERVIHAMTVSGSLLFEPQAGEPLGSFWFFERNAANSGNLFVDFNIAFPAPIKTPWSGLGPVLGPVGYTHEGGRGRLDMTALGPDGQAGVTDRGVLYAFARVIISSRHAELDGCRRAMVIRWAGARFITRFEGDLRVPPGPGQVVTWNAPRGGTPRATARGPAAFWTPARAPQSWGALWKQVPAITEFRLIDHDSTAAKH